ncbi:hypothetical protein AB1Y20_009142 [Prymnesium parvum]|uniref:PIH1 domain-containing protein 1 n=1 Tax=Prymnesium parvum TaxID=97485 RepID=A0AB34K3H7_PRYPA
MVEDTSNLSVQEQEMLAYLEDLQQNNPAEYELLVQQMQAQRQAAGGGAATSGEAEQVTPRPGFVAKTVSATSKGQKVFINVCQSEHVDPPAPVEAGNDAEEVQYRIPLSLGPPREDLDKDGAVCTVYDVVFHPDAVDNSLSQAEFRSFVMSLTLHQIQTKYKDELSSDIKYPKVKGNYKGVAPLPQLMRKKGSPPPRSEHAEAKPSSGDTQGKSKIEEIVTEKASPDLLPTPAYAVEPRMRETPSGASTETGAEPDGTNVKIHLPLVEHADELEVRLSSDSLEVHAPSKYSLFIQLPQSVLLNPLYAKFESCRRILSISLLFAPSASSDKLDEDSGPHSAALEAVEAKDGFEGEMARRAREKAAREKARARRAEARRAVASGEAPQVGSIPNASGKVRESTDEPQIVEVTDEPERLEDECGRRDAKPAERPEKNSKRSTLLEISNSIIDELEE